MWQARARPAARAVPIRRTGRASPPRTIRRSTSFRQNSSTTDCRECVATASDARRCQARSALRPHAGSMRRGRRFAEPACPAIPNATWRGAGMGCRCWLRTDLTLPLEEEGDGHAFVKLELGRNGLRHVDFVDVVLDRGERAERLGRERDRLAVAI